MKPFRQSARSTSSALLLVCLLGAGSGLSGCRKKEVARPAPSELDGAAEAAWREGKLDVAVGLWAESSGDSRGLRDLLPFQELERGAGDPATLAKAGLREADAGNGKAANELFAKARFSARRVSLGLAKERPKPDAWNLVGDLVYVGRADELEVLRVEERGLTRVWFHPDWVSHGLVHYQQHLYTLRRGDGNGPDRLTKAPLENPAFHEDIELPDAKYRHIRSIHDGLALISTDLDRGAEVWRLEAHERVASFEYLPGKGTTLSPDGRYLFTHEDQLHRWDVAGGRRLANIAGVCRGKPSMANCAEADRNSIIEKRFHPSRRIVYTEERGGDDYALHAWDTDSGRHLWSSERHGRLEFSLDSTGTRGALAVENAVHVVDAVTGRLERRFMTTPLHPLAVLFAEPLLLVEMKESVVHALDLGTGRRVFRIVGGVHDWGIDGDRLALVAEFSTAVEVHSLSNGALLGATEPLIAQLGALTASASGAVVATADGEGGLFLLGADGHFTRHASGAVGLVALEVSANGETLALVDERNTVHVSHPPGSSPTEFQLPAWHDAPNPGPKAREAISALAVSAKGSLLAIGTDAGKVLVYERERGAWSFSIQAHPDAVSMLAFSLHEGDLYSAGNASGIFRWRVESGSKEREYPGRTFVALSPDGRVMGACQGGEPETARGGGGCRTLVLWDLAAGSVLREQDLSSEIEQVRLSNRHVYLDVAGDFQRWPLDGSGESDKVNSRGIWNHQVVANGEVVLARSPRGTISVYASDLKPRGFYRLFRDQSFLASIDQWVDASPGREAGFVTLLEMGRKDLELDPRVGWARFFRRGAFRRALEPPQRNLADFYR